MAFQCRPAFYRRQYPRHRYRAVSTVCLTSLMFRLSQSSRSLRMWTSLTDDEDCYLTAVHRSLSLNLSVSWYHCAHRTPSATAALCEQVNFKMNRLRGHCLLSSNTSPHNPVLFRYIYSILAFRVKRRANHRLAVRRSDSGAGATTGAPIHSTHSALPRACVQ